MLDLNEPMILFCNVIVLGHIFFHSTNYTYFLL